MNQAPQSVSLQQEGMSIYARARVCIICVVACATLGWAHQSNIEHVELGPAHRIEDEQARIMLRDALIKESIRGQLAVDPAPPEPTVRTSRGVSEKAYTIRADMRPAHSPMTLRAALEDLDTIKSERRDRMKARGEDVSDMDASGLTKLESVINSVPSTRYEKLSCFRHMRPDGRYRPRRCYRRWIEHYTDYEVGSHDVPPQNAPLEAYTTLARNTF